MTVRWHPSSTARLATLGIFTSGISGLAMGCHESLDLLVDSVDAAVTTAPEAGAPDAQQPARPPRVPPEPCTVDSDCAALGGVCATDKGICVECTAAGQCPLQRLCDPVTNQCVGCLLESDCSRSGWTCDSLTHECGLSCSSKQDCPSTGFPIAFPICSGTRHICVMCETDSDCSQLSSLSRLPLRCRLGACGQCWVDDDCPDNRPYCDPRIGFCEECNNSDQCPVGMSCAPSIPTTEFLRQCQ